MGYVRTTHSKVIKKGYEVYPVNPKEIENNILGKRCYSNLFEIEKKIDMVDVFRAKEYVFDITKDAIEINANILWTQEGIIDENAASLGKNSGLIVVMNECPKKVLDA